MRVACAQSISIETKAARPTGLDSLPRESVLKIPATTAVRLRHESTCANCPPGYAQPHPFLRNIVHADSRSAGPDLTAIIVGADYREVYRSTHMRPIIKHSIVRDFPLPAKESTDLWGSDAIAAVLHRDR